MPNEKKNAFHDPLMQRSYIGQLTYWVKKMGFSGITNVLNGKNVHSNNITLLNVYKMNPKNLIKLCCDESFLIRGTFKKKVIN